MRILRLKTPVTAFVHQPSTKLTALFGLGLIAVMAQNDSSFTFHRQMLDCVVGGISALDIARLNIQSISEAREFVRAYGYDMQTQSDLDQLWTTYRRAVELIRQNLLEPGERIPERLTDPTELKELAELLLFASSRKPNERELQRWACAILRVMHVYVHLRHDLFSAFRDEIQVQILKPLQDSISMTHIPKMASANVNQAVVASTILGPGMIDGDIHLHKFEVKPFKTTASSVIKLLARPERVALTLLDKLGVRFVTRSVFDSFRVIRFLVESHILSYPHIIPDQSNNTLYPLNLFLEVMEDLKKSPTVPDDQAIEAILNQRLEQDRNRAKFLAKENEFSGPEYRFVKFISRKLITVSVGPGETQRAFRFFYPYEIQVMDQETYKQSLSGPGAHDEYKNRQRRKARERALDENPNKNAEENGVANN